MTIIHTYTHTYIKCCLVMIFCPKKKEERLKSSAAFPESTALDSSLDVAGQEIFFQDFVM